MICCIAAKSLHWLTNASIPEFLKKAADSDQISIVRTSYEAKVTMTKSMTSLWLQSLRRISKAQQTQSRKLFKTILSPAVRAPAASLANAGKLAKIVKTIRPASLKLVGGITRPAVKKTKLRRKADPVSARPSSSSLTALAGSWKKSFFSLPATALAPAHRMMYWLYLPAGVPDAPRPLIVMLHGCKQTATDFAASTRMNQLAERKGFAVLYPQQSAAADANRCWPWYRRATQHGHGDVALIASMIERVRVQHRLDPSRTYVTGLSAGAALAAILALRHPYLFAGAGLHSAPVYGTSDSPISGFQAMQQGASLGYADAVREFTGRVAQFPGMPVMLIQGKSDPVVRRVNLDHLAAQFLLVNAPFIANAKPVVRSYGARLSGRSPRHGYTTMAYPSGRKPMLVKCEIDALGHAWSGGEGSQAYSAPEGPDATLLLWTFFSRQQRAILVPAAL